MFYDTWYTFDSFAAVAIENGDVITMSSHRFFHFFVSQFVSVFLPTDVHSHFVRSQFNRDMYANVRCRFQYKIFTSFRNSGEHKIWNRSISFIFFPWGWGFQRGVCTGLRENGTCHVSAMLNVYFYECCICIMHN